MDRMNGWQGWLAAGVVAAGAVAAVSAMYKPTPAPPPVQDEVRQDTVLVVMPCLDGGAVHATAVSAYTQARFPHRVHFAAIVPVGTPADRVRASLEGMGLFLWATNVRWVASDAGHQSDDAARALVSTGEYDLVLHVRDGVEFDANWDTTAMTDFLNASKRVGTTRVVVSRPPTGFAAVEARVDPLTRLPRATELPAVLPMPMSTAWWCGRYALAPGFVCAAVPFDAYLAADAPTAEVVYSARLHRAGVRVVHPARVPLRVVHDQTLGTPCSLAGGRRLRSQLGLTPPVAGLPDAPLTPEALTAFSVYSGVEFSTGRIVGGAWGLTTESCRREHLNKTGQLAK